ncbi:MAG: hypothetical protein RL318_2906, partial [Fibrobacterota bacterium]|jgi:hypothetical protein
LRGHSEEGQEEHEHHGGPDQENAGVKPRDGSAQRHGPKQSQRAQIKLQDRGLLTVRINFFGSDQKPKALSRMASKARLSAYP